MMLKEIKQVSNYAVAILYTTFNVAPTQKE